VLRFGRVFRCSEMFILLVLGFSCCWLGKLLTRIANAAMIIVLVGTRECRLTDFGTFTKENDSWSLNLLSATSRPMSSLIY
jgi:hypothetical protein